MANSKLTPLLVVEDDPGLQSQLKWCFEGYQVYIAGDKATAINELRRHEPPVVTLDLGLPPDPANASQGIETLEEILRLAPNTKVIVVTGNDDKENAIKCVAMGAYDFYQKPIDPDTLKLLINRAKQLYDLETAHRQISQQANSSTLDGIIAASTEMMNICRNIEKISSAEITTLLLGESGTGKEIIAHTIHQKSSRANNKFLAINCAAIPESLLESELFGYEKGSFTGANKQTLGKIEVANGGTFFLDEVGDLPMSLQAKMLRFLQERVIERVGGRVEIPIDVRIICATHQNLQELITSGKFREDLYYRISEITINIPPLRNREGDACLLARAFLEKYQKNNSKQKLTFTTEALKAIETYSWPGNVRELENKIKRAIVMAENKKIDIDDLELNQELDKTYLNLRQVREEAEKTAIRRALSVSNSSISKTAEILGVSRPTLYDLMNKYGMK